MAPPSCRLTSATPLARLVEVEDQVQLAHVLKVVVQDLDKEVDGLEQHQLVVRHVYAHGEVEAGVLAVDDLVGAVLQCEVGTRTRQRRTDWVGGRWRVEVLRATQRPTLSLCAAPALQLDGGGAPCSSML